MGIDSMGMGGSGNVKSHSRSSLLLIPPLRHVGIISHTASSAWFKILQCHSVFLMTLCQSGVTNLQHRALGGFIHDPPNLIF